MIEIVGTDDEIMNRTITFKELCELLAAEISLTDITLTPEKLEFFDDEVIMFTIPNSSNVFRELICSAINHEREYIERKTLSAHQRKLRELIGM